MFNHFLILNAEKKFRKITSEEKRNDQWIKRYKTEVRPNLINKHQRRIQGFAKKMQCEPIQLAQKGQVYKTIENKVVSRSEKKIKISEGKKVHQLSSRLKTYTQIQRANNVQNLKQLISKKYISPAQSFRLRQRDKQINPPMKYGNKNSKLVLAAISARKNWKRQDPEQQVRQRNHSRSSLKSNYESDFNYSDFDIMSIKEIHLQQKAQNFKTEQQQKQEQELKALSKDRLYFKSLVDMEQKMKDQAVKQNLRKILVKCKVFKSGQHHNKEHVQRDQFAEVMKLVAKDSHSPNVS